jgi:hypothetical protein
MNGTVYQTSPSASGRGAKLTQPVAFTRTGSRSHLHSAGNGGAVRATGAAVFDRQRFFGDVASRSKGLPCYPVLLRGAHLSRYAQHAKTSEQYFT